MDTATGAALTNPGGLHEVLATALAATSAGKPRDHIQRVQRTAQWSSLLIVNLAMSREALLGNE
jgi:hypothetical protein